MTNPEQAVDAALREARNNALEEAARVLDARVRLALECDSRHVARVLQHQAARIRALKEPNNG